MALRIRLLQTCLVSHDVSIFLELLSRWTMDSSPLSCKRLGRSSRGSLKVSSMEVINGRPTRPKSVCGQGLWYKAYIHDLMRAPPWNCTLRVLHTVRLWFVSHVNRPPLEYCMVNIIERRCLDVRVCFAGVLSVPWMSICPISCGVYWMDPVACIFTIWIYRHPTLRKCKFMQVLGR